MELKTVALIGAGAVGAYFIWGMSEQLGSRFCVVADGARGERLAREGMQINGRHYSLNVKSPQEASGVDLLLVATKYNSLPGVLDTIETVTAPHTVVLSLLNGVDSEEIIGGRIGMEHMVYSLMRIASTRDGHGIRFDPDNTMGLFFGEKGCPEKTARVLALEALLEETAIRYHFMPDILSDQWKKFALNITYNLPQAVLGAGYRCYFDSEHMAYLRDRLLEEVTQVAASRGITFGALENQRDTCKADARFSTLQDLDAGRHTEIDMFLGVLMRMAAEAGIQVPFSEYTYHIIKALEEKNDGVFNYEQS